MKRIGGRFVLSVFWHISLSQFDTLDRQCELPVRLPLVKGSTASQPIAANYLTCSMPTFKQLLAGDRLVRIFSIPRIVHPIIFDMFGLAGGFDGFWLDQEHGGTTYEQVMLASRSVRGPTTSTAWSAWWPPTTRW